MKRLIFTAFILFSILLLCAQENGESRDFHRHEVRVSFGDAIGTTAQAGRFNEGSAHSNFSISYFFRPARWFWVGTGFVNYFGNKIHHHWREYDTHGNYQDFTESRRNSAIAIVAPEIRISYINRQNFILYSGFSVVVVWENGYGAISERTFHDHITLFGFSSNFGRNYNFFFGGELGAGVRSLFSLHAGFRF